jgi:predicted metalloprotease
MRWERGDRSNIEDLRGRSPVGLTGLGIGGFLVLLVLSWLSGTNLFSLLGTVTPGDNTTTGTAGELRTSPAEERMVDFVDAVTNDVQNTWSQLLGSRYQRTRVVLFRDAIQSACGSAESATGPFYCPNDGRVYLDLGFFNELAQRFGAPGDFAQAYVVASAWVALELQADCFAGIWGHAASRGGQLQAGQVQLEPGDADEALRAAAAIGDDRLQRMATGRVMPERFTHGSSTQRVEAFRRGMTSGDPRACGSSASSTH